MGSEGATSRRGTRESGAPARRRGSRFTLGQTWYLAAGVLGAIVPFGLLAVQSGFDPKVIGFATGSVGVYAVTLAGVMWFLRRRKRRRQQETLGMHADLDALRGDSALVEQLRERVVSVGVIKIGDQDGRRYNDATREHIQSFVITRDGENADIETHADSAHVIAGARWLAMELDVPLIDGRDSLHRSFSPAELAGVDDDLRVIHTESEPVRRTAESEPMCRTTEPEPMCRTTEPEPMCRTTEPESESESEPDPDPDPDPEPEPEPRSEPESARTRRAARARQRT